MPWELSVTYPAREYPRLDAAIDTLVGRRHGDSGIGLGYRDLHWQFDAEPIAQRAARRVMGADLPGVVAIVSPVDP